MKNLFMIIATLFAFTGSAYAYVNINTATQAELETLKNSGITSFKAKAIIEYRKKAGAFTSTEHIERVEGVNNMSVNMEQLRRDITISGPTVLKTVAPAK
ncbi:MAG: ComE operon protein 1 [Nitrosomonadaceae bacterium]|nr:helix-hairpin-helix domain-containing protein [Nitrosospira sp.]MBI0413778.1 helix-hairpin-helix domain-containing protein [Nitrosospira sp.]MCG3771718.1 ComE operon protein 1 [Nitrosomonadaceae bacterium]